MSFLGKEYTLVRDENFDAFLRSTGLPDDKIAAFATIKPTQKIVKNADNSYTVTVSAPHESRESTFTLGKEFVDTSRPDETVKVTYNLDGNNATQIIKGEKDTVTFKREFKGDEMIETITSDNWDGVAHRYYKA